MGRINFFVKRLLKKVLSLSIKSSVTRKKLRVFFVNLFSLRYFHRKIKDIDTNNLFDYRESILPKFHWHVEIYRGNLLYGIENTIKKYANSNNKSIKACIEHGVYFGDTVFDAETNDSGFKAIITYSGVRKEHIQKKSNLEVLPIGPYIHYAFIPKGVDFKKIKKNNGKTLIAFPMHSTEEIKCKYDIQEFIEKIKIVKEKNEFQTVLVCMYYKDILLNRDRPYLDAGFNVVTAGYQSDPLFLSRLKSLLKLSDHVITNDLGTHVGYAVFMKKPVYITYQNREYVGRDKKEVEENAPITHNQSTVREREDVRNHFQVFTTQLTYSQIDVCNKYWGFDYILSSSELRKKLTKIEKDFYD